MDAEFDRQVPERDGRTKRWEPKTQAAITTSFSAEQVMLANIRKIHDSTIDRYRRLGLNNSTIAWLLFAEGLFVVLVGKTIVDLIN